MSDEHPIIVPDIEMSGLILVNRFLIAQDLRVSSKEAYFASLQEFFRWLNERNIARPTKQDVLNFKTSLISRNISPNTISQYITALHQLFAWTAEEGIYDNIAKAIKTCRPVKGFRKDSLSVKQIFTLLTKIDRSTIEGKRDYAIINLSIRLGLRTIETTRIDIGDISNSGGETVLYVHGKGRDQKDEFLILTDEALSPIMEYLGVREGRKRNDDPLFVSHSRRNPNERLTTGTIRFIVKKYLRDIGLDSPRLSAHSLRHTAISISILGGAKITEAQTLARHASLTSTSVYSHNLDRFNSAAEKKIAALLKNAELSNV